MVYDICTDSKEGRRRLSKALKICRKYLNHVQKSVFEGDITEGKLHLLRRELLALVDKDLDFVIIYKLSEGATLERDILTNTPDPTSNML